MSAPTQLDQADDDLATPATIRRGGHDYRRTGSPGRPRGWLHLASCSCWSSPPCSLCRRDHATAGRCRWAKWLGRP